MPRVISGKAKGLILKSLPGKATRPSLDRTKEAVFSILQDTYVGGRVLDLYAGSGQLGIEALSRGAERAVLVDQSGKAVQIVKENLEKTRLKEKADVYKMNALSWLKGPGKTIEKSFHVIFFDPPYEITLDELKKLGPYLEALLAPGGILVVESESHAFPLEKYEAAMPNIPLVKHCKYGSAMVSFYKISDETGA